MTNVPITAHVPEKKMSAVPQKTAANEHMVTACVRMLCGGEGASVCAGAQGRSACFTELPRAT
jgi:hypothetical protein